MKYKIGIIVAAGLVIASLVALLMPPGELPVPPLPPIAPDPIAQESPALAPREPARPPAKTSLPPAPREQPAPAPTGIPSRPAEPAPAPR
ncbi:MAG: dihydrolipoamide succinyltransferase, partial [Chthoniobacteraceae bacterium]